MIKLTSHWEQVTQIGSASRIILIIKNPEKIHNAGKFKLIFQSWIKSTRIQIFPIKFSKTFHWVEQVRCLIKKLKKSVINFTFGRTNFAKNRIRTRKNTWELLLNCDQLSSVMLSLRTQVIHWCQYIFHWTTWLLLEMNNALKNTRVYLIN